MKMNPIANKYQKIQTHTHIKTCTHDSKNIDLTMKAIFGKNTSMIMEPNDKMNVRKGGKETKRKKTRAFT